MSNSDVEPKHIIHSEWREADLNALDERIKAISEWLDHTEDLVDMFGDDLVSTELRSLAGLMKTKRNDFTQKSNELQAALHDAE